MGLKFTDRVRKEGTRHEKPAEFFLTLGTNKSTRWRCVGALPFHMSAEAP